MSSPDLENHQLLLLNYSLDLLRGPLWPPPTRPAISGLEVQNMVLYILFGCRFSLSTDWLYWTFANVLQSLRQHGIPLVGPLPDFGPDSRRGGDISHLRASHSLPRATVLDHPTEALSVGLRWE